MGAPDRMRREGDEGFGSASTEPASAEENPQRSSLLSSVFHQLVDGGWGPWIPLFCAGKTAGSLQLCSAIGTAIALIILVLNFIRWRHFNTCAEPPPASETPDPDPYGLPFPILERLAPWRIFPKYFDVITAVCLVVILMLAYCLPQQIAAYANVLTWAPFAAGVWFTFILGEPFTTQYAKEATPEETWGTNIFIALNFRMSLGWGVALTLGTLSSAVCLLSAVDCGSMARVVSVWVVPFGGLVLAIYFTSVYPAYYMESEMASMECKALVEEAGTHSSSAGYGSGDPAGNE